MFDVITLTPIQIKEIAEQLECGFICHFNPSNKELLFVPDINNHHSIELDAWKDDLKKIHENFDDYILIEPPKSSDSYNFMAEFIETLNENNLLKRTLTEALEKRKPFKEFKFIIDNSGESRQKWFDFKSAKLQEWVKNELGVKASEE